MSVRRFPVTLALASLIGMTGVAASGGPPAAPIPDEMTWQAWLCLATIIAVILSLLLDVAPVTAVMFCSTLMLMVASVIQPADFLSGFTTTSIISIAHLFIVVEPLSKLTRVRKLVYLAMSGATPDSGPFGLVWPRFKVCLLTIVLSMFANQNPVVVLLTPMIKQYCREHGLSPKQFLMPLAYASALGGSLTLVGTSVNLTYNGLMQNAGMSGMAFFELIKTTAIPALIALPYLVVMPSFMLSNGGGMFRLVRERNNEFLAQFLVSATSPLVGQTVECIDALMPESMKQNTSVIELVRPDGTELAPPRASDSIGVNDLLVFTGPVVALKNCAKMLHLRWIPNGDVSTTTTTATAAANGTPMAAAAVMTPCEAEATREPSANASLTGCKILEPSPLLLSSPPVITQFQRLQSVGVMPRSSSNGELPRVRSLRGSFAAATASALVGNTSPPTPANALVGMRVNGSFSQQPAEFPSAAVGGLGGATDETLLATTAGSSSTEPDFMEVVLSYRCPALGATVGSGVFQRRYGVSILALRKCHGSEDFTSQSRLHDVIMRLGDTLLLFGGTSFVEQLEGDFSLISFSNSKDEDTRKEIQDNFVVVPNWMPFGQLIEDRSRSVSLVRALANVVGAPRLARRTTAQHPHYGADENGTSSGGGGADRIEIGHTDDSSSNTIDALSTTTTTLRAVRIPASHRYLSILIFVVMIIFTIAGYDVFVTSALAVAATVLLKVLSVRDAINAVDMNVMLSIIYSFGLGIALTKSGLAGTIGKVIAGSSLHGFGLLFVIAAIGTVVTNAITNKACAQVLFPIVVSIYREAGLDPLPPVMILCAVSSWAFCTPYGKPTNLIIMGPGGYSAVDYAKFGIPLNLMMIPLIAASSALVYGT